MVAMKTEIEQARERVVELKAQLSDAEAELRRLLIEAAPFKEGDEVEASPYGRSIFSPAIIRRVIPRYLGTTYIVSFRKKDGTWMTRETETRNVQARRPENG